MKFLHLFTSLKHGQIIDLFASSPNNNPNQSDTMDFKNNAILLF